MAVNRVVNGVQMIQMGMANVFLIEADAGYPHKERVVTIFPRRKPITTK
jgi:hypothetical protein